MMDGPAERRRFERIPIAQAATAISGEAVGQVLDISMGGMAILHHGLAWPRDHGEVSLRIAGRRFRLPVRVVWDVVVEQQAEAGEGPAWRRCGLALGMMTPRKMGRLESFLWSQAKGGAKLSFPGEELN